MPSADIESYRNHQVWEVIDLKLGALETTRFGNAPLEGSRMQVTKVLQAALRSRASSSQPYLYMQVLDDLRDNVNIIQTDEYAFSNFVANYLGPLQALVRALPGPPAKNMPERYAHLLDEALELREQTIVELRDQVTELSKTVEIQRKLLESHASSVKQQSETVQAAKDEIQEVATSTESALNESFEGSLKAWMNKRDQKDSELNDRMEDQVSLLTAAAQVGQRLVEHAAGNLTATNWADRATRERRNGFSLRVLAIVFGFAGLALAYYIVDRAVKQDFDLTVGDGLLRGAAIIAVIAVGGYFAAESRRHYAESDTAEEVATAMLAIEPYYAGASDDDRTAARNAIGETVFVKNVLSRFTSRDAGRHNEAVSSQDLSQIVDELTKALKAAQDTSKS
jgi:hypothetical protein